MATKTHTTYEHSCDICGEVRDRDELRHLYGPPPARAPLTRGKEADISAASASRARPSCARCSTSSARRRTRSRSGSSAAAGLPDAGEHGGPPAVCGNSLLSTRARSIRSFARVFEILTAGAGAQTAPGALDGDRARCRATHGDHGRATTRRPYRQPRPFA